MQHRQLRANARMSAFALSFGFLVLMLLLFSLAASSKPDAAIAASPAIPIPTVVETITVTPFTGCSSVIGVSQTECEALVALYRSTDGPKWTDHSNWLETNDPCEWQGVTCGGDYPNYVPSYVKYLQLQDNGLRGELPHELGNLADLTILIMSGNELTGSIPIELGNIRYFEELDLSKNRLAGPIPATLYRPFSSAPTESSHLTVQDPSTPYRYGFLGLSANQLEGPIPRELCSTSSSLSLTFNLGYNKLMGIGDSGLDCLKQKDPDWAETQTVAPTNVGATVLPEGDIQLTWTPISYTADGGYYQILYSTLPGGPYINPGTLRTSDKTGNQLRVSGLPANNRYYFVVQTFTPAHYSSPGWQQNDLLSAASEEVSATLTADMEIIKSPSSQETYAGPRRTLASDAEFVITLTNTGNVPLTSVAVTDLQTADCTKNLGAIPPGGTNSYRCKHSNAVSSFTNEAQVVGLTGTGLAVTRTASADVTSREVELTVYGTGVGTDHRAVRTITATLFYTLPFPAPTDYSATDSSRGFYRTPVPGQPVTMTVSGGTTYIDSKLTDLNGQAIFSYVSAAPRSQGAQADSVADAIGLAEVQRADATDRILVWVDLLNNGIYDTGEPVQYHEVPTAITLASFMAEYAGDTVVVRWTTAVERDNAGFNLYRAAASVGPYVKLNDQLIAAEGNGTGASYRFVDTPRGSGPFYYKLEDVDFNGTSTLHGPIQAPTGFMPLDGVEYLYLPALKR